MTVKINCRVLDNASFGHDFEARLTVGRIKKVSFDMIIDFLGIRQQKVFCETQHTIVFVDSRTGEFAPIPEEMKQVIIRYQNNDEILSK